MAAPVHYTTPNELGEAVDLAYAAVIAHYLRPVIRKVEKEIRSVTQEQPKAEIWRNDKSGFMFHDICFEPGESREGFTPVGRDELDADDECESCGGNFLVGISNAGVEEPEDDDDDDDDDEKPSRYNTDPTNEQ